MADPASTSIVIPAFGEGSAIASVVAALRRAAPWTDRRRAIAASYRRQLANPAVPVPPELDAGHVYHLFPVVCARREALQAHLTAAGIETLIHYPVPIPRQPALVSSEPGECPTADRICAQVLSLPLYPSLPDEAVSLVASAVASFQ